MAKNIDDKKTALKLVNKYADSYNILEEENKSLRSEVRDIKANLKINKEIIEGFFNSSNKKDQYSIYINKLKEENLKINKQMENIQSERDVYRTKLTYLEQSNNEAVNRERDENEKNKNKIFIMDNALLKKDNIIAGLKKKLEKNSDDDKFNQLNDREVYVVEPTVAINQIQDELLLYKQIYENLVTHIKESRESRIKYESVINELQNNNTNLRSQMKLHILSANREKENIYLKEKEEQNKGQTKSTNNETEVNSKKYSMTTSNKEAQIPVDLTKLKNKLKVNDDVIKNITSGSSTINTVKKSENNHSQSEEWIEILRHSGLTPEEMDRLSRNKMLSKIIEAIEMLNRLLCDKNLQIRLLEQENENLNQKNFSLNRDNISLFQKSLEIKKELTRHSNKGRKSENDVTDSSIVNNTSRITINNLNINAMSTLKKKNEKDKENFNTTTTGENINIISNVKNNSNSKSPTTTTLNYSNKEKTEISKNEKLTKEYLNNYKDIIFKLNGKNQKQEDSNNDELEIISDENNNTIEYKKRENKNLNNCSEDDSSDNDSIIYTKDVTDKKNKNEIENKKQKMNNQERNQFSISDVNKQQNSDINKDSERSNQRDLILNTLESCTSSEFRAGIGVNEESFLSQGNNDIKNLNIEIKHSNI